MKLPTDKYFEKYLLFHFGLLVLAVILLAVVCLFLYKQINLQSIVDDSLQTQITNLQNQKFKTNVGKIGGVNSSTETAGWKVYRNDQYGFEVKYPLNFEIQGESEDGRYVNFAPFTGTYIQVYAGRDSWKLPLQFRYMSSNNASSIDWSDLERGISEGGKYSIEQRQLVVNGNQWEMIIVKQPPDENSVILARYYLKHNGFFVVLDQSLMGDLTILNQMLSTFKFTK